MIPWGNCIGYWVVNTHTSAKNLIDGVIARTTPSANDPYTVEGVNKTPAWDMRGSQYLRIAHADSMNLTTFSINNWSMWNKLRPRFNDNKW